MNDMESNLSYCRDKYKEYKETYEEDMNILDEKIVEVGASQLKLEMRWGALEARVKGILSQAKDDTIKVFSEAFIAGKRDQSRIIDNPEAKQFAQCDESYHEAKTFENDVSKLLDAVSAKMNAVTTRKYTIKDIVALECIGSKNMIV